jgi:hypothetical protein
MKYLITTIFAVITFCFFLVCVKIGILVFTNSPMWIFVGIGVLMPTTVSALITSAAYSAAKDY